VSVVCLSRVRSRKLSEIGVAEQEYDALDFAPEVAINTPKVSCYSNNFGTVRAYCFAPLAMQLVRPNTSSCPAGFLLVMYFPRKRLGYMKSRLQKRVARYIDIHGTEGSSMNVKCISSNNA